MAVQWKLKQFRQVFKLACLSVLLPLNGWAAKGTIQDVQHVVILMQENRSFDHYYGCLKGVRGFNDWNVLMFTNGLSALCQPSGSGYVLPFPLPGQYINDVPHDQASGLSAWHGGKWDQWVLAKGATTMGYYSRADIPFYYALAESYTICDAYHCSFMGPTYPNRLFLMTGTIDPNGRNGGPSLDNGVPAGGFTWTTYPERLQQAGVSWRVYQQSGDFFPLNALPWFASFKNALPGNPLYDRGVALVNNVVAAFKADVTNGTLPRVSWIIPPWSYSEHPSFAPSAGELFTKQILEALAANPQVCNSTVFFHTYDEDGGFFDHVPPPVPPPGTTNEFVRGQPVGLGVRVPMLIISPWTRGGYVCSQVFDHTSVLRFLEKWTGVMEPNISDWRRQLCGDLTAAFNFRSSITNQPVLPSVSLPPYLISVITAPSSTQVQPIQESGDPRPRTLPYQPDLIALVDSANSRLNLTMTNAGANAMHLSIYHRSTGPWQYDIPGYGNVAGSFATLTNTGGLYDLTCYGPNGFHRRLAGTISTNTRQVEVHSLIDVDTGGIGLVFKNGTLTPVQFTLTNSYQAGPSWTISVPADSAMTHFLPCVATNDGWHDLTVTGSHDASFLRRFAGRVDTGPPRLASALRPGLAQISYPAWAVNYTLEYTTNLSSGIWLTEPSVISPTNNRNNIVAPTTDTTRYYRLRN